MASPPFLPSSESGYTSSVSRMEHGLQCLKDLSSNLSSAYLAWGLGLVSQLSGGSGTLFVEREY